MRIVLASASPRRKELLRGLGLSFEVVPSEVAEESPGEVSPAQAAAWALTLARRKAEDVAGRLRRRPSGKAAPAEAAADSVADDGPVLVVAADTLVVLPDRVLGKPSSEEKAAAMLRALAGRAHRVVTGVVVTEAGSGRTYGATEETEVFFRPLSETAIQAYIATGEPFDKAGGYAVQGVGSLLVERINGDYFNVVGLPLGCLAGLMERFGIDFLRLAAESVGRGGTRRD